MLMTCAYQQVVLFAAFVGSTEGIIEINLTLLMNDVSLKTSVKQEFGDGTTFEWVFFGFQLIIFAF